MLASAKPPPTASPDEICKLLEGMRGSADEWNLISAWICSWGHKWLTGSVTP